MSAAPAQAADQPAVWWRFRSWPGRLFDLGVVIALIAVGAAILLAGTNEVPRLALGRLHWYAIVLVALGSLLVRRRHPLVTLGVALASLMVEALVHSPLLVQPFVLVGIYTVAARLPWRVSLALGAATSAVFVTATAIGEGGPSFPETVRTLVPIAAAYIVGIYVGTRTAYIDALQARAQQLARERELLAEQAVAEERVRIARELHDVVAHHLSLITVQAAALETQLAPDSPARQTAESMARSGRQAMDEMRRMLRVLRLGVHEDPGRAPQPVIDEIPGLIEQARSTGLDVELSIHGTPRAVPPGVDLSAYRIVQEALTNVVRHAGPAHCRVMLGYANDTLELRVTDDGRGGSPPDDNRGHGLVGMRERVALFGGDLFAGPVPGGGFAVRATLPMSPRGPRL